MKKSKSQAERTAALRKLEENFHILDDIGSYTFAPYKVVWKLIAGAITGKAISFECAVLGSMNEKPFIPNEKLMMIPFNNLDEAYYVAGVLNSSISRLIVASYNIETEISAHIVKHITVPKFNADNSLHMKISILSRKAHEITKCIHAPLKPDYCKSIRDPEDELKKIERELDKAVAELYSIPEEVLKDFKRLLDILAGEGASEEIKGSEEPIPPSVDFTKIDVSADRMDYIEVSVSTAGVCSEVKLSVDAPWGSQVLSLGDGRHRIEVSLPEGMYELKYKFTCSNHSGEGVVRIASSKSVVAGPRKPSTLKLGVDL
ncbi:MAG: BREX-1 system adenine-specific DNA-methyltransferase PglX [Ignisphaera sp.]|nr:BREX-1 system adenine-specific DNA-methyltransferase PglX [Ignisphaera sp.]